jgi:Uma2 family endonuclease
MSTEPISAASADPSTLTVLSIRQAQLALQNGDQMSREEFHRLYEQTPEGFKAELIGGIVYVASPVYPGHGKPHLHLGAVVAAYEAGTPGVDASDNTTILLGNESEPQPDLYVRILPEYGGQSSTDENDCVVGAPELIIEIASSSRAFDLHAKKKDYMRYGVREYLVQCVAESELRWFDLATDVELHGDSAGILRMKTFPGLWINGIALLSRDYQRLMQALEEGLASPEHAAFVRDLAERRAKA